MSDTGNLLGQAASLDPAIRERVLNLANMALDQAEFLIKHGDPVMKGRLIQSFMVTFSKHMRTQDTDDELEKLRIQLEVLQGLVLGRNPGDDSQPELQVVEDVIDAADMVDLPPNSPPMIQQ